MSEKLYHYTSLETFLKIAESKMVRLSDLSQSNDALEGRYILDHLVRSLPTSQLPPEYFAIFESQMVQMIEYERAFGFCLSELKDDLSQWRGYGDDGNGICIGFDKSLFEPAIRGTHKITKAAKLLKVQYGQKSVQKIIDEFHRAINGIDWDSFSKKDFEHDFFLYWFIGGPDDLERDKASADAFVALSNSIANCFEFKAEAFAREEEWRILVSGKSYDEDIVSYNASRNRIVAFMSASIGQSISEVVIGPKCLVTKKDMERVLSRLRIRCPKARVPNVSVSDASYR